ncbi:MAG: hypothetical protein J7641_08615 [Cyanobacteria bacterium SID2]|nr:hypothetical protein [Cyanobacteria bacterium SID2]MBP0006059.1 hypothetical protein [Cyanobacteria bacterium SBC]
MTNRNGIDLRETGLDVGETIRYLAQQMFRMEKETPKRQDVEDKVVGTRHPT